MFPIDAGPLSLLQHGVRGGVSDAAIAWGPGCRRLILADAIASIVVSALMHPMLRCRACLTAAWSPGHRRLICLASSSNCVCIVGSDVCSIQWELCVFVRVCDDSSGDVLFCTALLLIKISLTCCSVLIATHVKVLTFLISRL